MASPTDVAHMGHRYQVLIKNNTSGSTVRADRIQSIDPTLTSNLEKAYELGTVDPVGTATDPTEYRVVIEENLHNSEVELLLAGKNPTSGSSYNVGEFVSYLDHYIYELIRDNDGTLLNELEYGGGALAEIVWRFVQGGACTTTLTFNCKSGKLYTSGSAPHTWAEYAADTTSPGIIKGKDARLYLGGTTDPTHITYRLQSFTLRCAFPIQVVRELGNRTLVGYVVDSPDATLDFDLLDADMQPADVLTNLTSGYYDFGDLQEIDGAIRLYDPTAAEATTIVKAWKLENLRVATGTVKRAQVRGLATQRYSMAIGKADTADSGGVLVYCGGEDIP